MVLRLAGTPRRLRSVPAPGAASADDFYDDTIAHAWPLALALYGGAPERAASAVVTAYGAVWLSGRLDRTSLLSALVEGARSHRREPGAVVLPLSRRRRAVTGPPMPA